MAQNSIKDKPWIVTATGCVATDASLNKFSGTWPTWVFVLLWITAAICLLVWAMRVGKADVIKQRFLDAPAFYIIMLLIIAPFGIAATNAMYSRLGPGSAYSSLQAVKPVDDSHLDARHTSPSSDQQQVRTLPDATRQSGSKQEKDHSARQVKPRSSAISQGFSSSTPLSAAIQQPVYGNQTCIGGACAQGEGSQATFNQYGPVKLHMSDEQAQTITEVMSQFKYSTIMLTCIYEEESLNYCAKLSRALQNAGIKVDGPHTVGIDMSHPDIGGVSFFRSLDRTSDAEALGRALMTAGLASNMPSIETESQPGTFEVVVRPNK